MADFLTNLLSLPKKEDNSLDYNDPKLYIPATIAAGLAIGPVIYKKFIASKVPSDVSNNHSYNVLIIGGSRGIGLYLAKHFLLLGDAVIITSRSQKGIDTARSKLSSMVNINVNLNGVTCDISNNESIEECYVQANKIFEDKNSGQIDIIINNAGISYPKRHDFLWNVESNDLRRVIDVNCNGTIILISNQKQFKIIEK